jgi:hypothetical protein
VSSDTVDLKLRCRGGSEIHKIRLAGLVARAQRLQVIFRKPKLHSVRRKFLWWPTRLCLTYNELRPEYGAELVPFVPGFHQSYPGAYRSRNKQNAKQCGGMVMSPVSWQVFTQYDGWYWLEWIVVQRQVHSSTGPSVLGFSPDGTRTCWQVIQPTKQWNMWHEYFD